MASISSEPAATVLLSPGWWSKVKQRLGRSKDRNATPSTKNRSSSAPRAQRRESSPMRSDKTEKRYQRRSASVERNPRRRIGFPPDVETPVQATFSPKKSARSSTRSQARNRRAVTVQSRPAASRRVAALSPPRLPQRLLATFSGRCGSSSSTSLSSERDFVEPQRDQQAKAGDSDSDNSEVIPLDVASVDLWMQDKSGDFFESQRSARLRSALVEYAGGYAGDDISTDSDSSEDLEGGPDSSTSLSSAGPSKNSHPHRQQHMQSDRAGEGSSPIRSIIKIPLVEGVIPSHEPNPDRLDNESSDRSSIQNHHGGVITLLRKSSSFAFKVRTTESPGRRMEAAASASEEVITKSSSEPHPGEVSSLLSRRVSFNNMKSRRAHLKSRSGRKTQPSPRHAPRNHNVEPERGILKQKPSSESVLSNAESFSSSVSGSFRMLHSSATASRTVSLDVPLVNDKYEMGRSPTLGLPSEHLPVGALAVCTHDSSGGQSATRFDQFIPEARSSAEPNSSGWTPMSLSIARAIPSSPTESFDSTSDSDRQEGRGSARTASTSLQTSLPDAPAKRTAAAQASEIDCRLSTACALLEQARRGSGSGSSVGDPGALHKLGSLPRNGQGVESVMDMLFDSPEIRSFLVQALQHKVAELHPGKEIDVSDTRLLMQVVGLTRWLKMSTKRWDALIQGSALLLSASDPSSKLRDT